MSDVDHIVVGYDGGSAGADAIAFGNCWCLASGDTMAVVTVHPGPASQRVDAEWTAHQRDRAASFHDEARALVADGVQAEFRQVVGDSAAHTLHDLAEQEGTLVVLGTRHRSGGRRTAPGSTANRLFQGSRAPVAIVPSGYSRRGAEPLRRVTASYVDTVDGRVALEQAGRIAQHLGADLRVVTVVPDTRVIPTTGEPRRFADAVWQEYERALGAAVSGLPPAGRVTSEMLDGHVVDALSDIGPEESDLLVIGSRGYGPLRRVFLGGVSAQVVRHARIPVVVVPRGR
ncbi:MAG: universal stress protein [Dermatophilaceae bacterium]